MSSLEIEVSKQQSENSFPLRVFDYQQLLIKYLNYVVLNNELMKVNNELNTLIKKLKRQCSRDGQTGLYNYRYLRQRLNIEFKRARRYQEPLTCIMLDIDHFKSINDTYGHRFGDFVLRKLGYMLRHPLRETDIVARYGGDEFGIIVPNTGYHGAFIIAQKIHERITGYDFRYNGICTNITVSLGLASLPDDQVLSPGQLIDFADKALYQVKKNGGNAILGFQDIGKFPECGPIMAFSRR
ncbi:MAG: GGDEF domain-containing protein [bacterium]|nr:GGDEF domain-containing protein [bacterium]